MKILVHDYPGHAFALQLSRWLAAQGHEVRHAWSTDVESPHGDLSLKATDTGNFSLLPLGSNRPLPKYSLVKRLLRERRYGRQLATAVHQFQPDIVLCNAPPVVLSVIQERLAKHPHIRLVGWVQDLYAPAFAGLFGQHFGWLGSPLVSAVNRLEITALAHCHSLIVIAESFKKYLMPSGIPAPRIHVLPNWPVLSELPLESKNNAWSRQHSLKDKFVFLYSGTLGLKHNPQRLVQLAQALQELPGKTKPQVVVVSQGPGRRLLEKALRNQSLGNLQLFDYQPHAVLPQVLGTADVLVSLLEPAAGEFSVPSKILGYLCAGRVQLAAIPAANPAARLLKSSGAAHVVDPHDLAAFVAAARDLYHDATTRKKAAKAARVYAEQNFDIDRIGNRFLKILSATNRA